MDPAEFLKVLDSNGQLPGVVGEIARSKALAIVLSKAKVVDTKKKPVDVSAFVARALGDGGSGEDFEPDDHAGHDRSGHDHAGHDHAGHDNK
jgi:trigger factor